MDDEQCAHRVRRATAAEQMKDCCGDRYESNVEYACTCGTKACRACMESHLFEVHR